MNKYRAKKSYDKEAMEEIYWVEKTDERYGFPAVILPKQPRFFTMKQAEEFAKHLNEEVEQLSLLDQEQKG